MSTSIPLVPAGPFDADRVIAWRKAASTLAKTRAGQLDDNRRAKRQVEPQPETLRTAAELYDRPDGLSTLAWYDACQAAMVARYAAVDAMLRAAGSADRNLSSGETDKLAEHRRQLVKLATVLDMIADDPSVGRN